MATHEHAPRELYDLKNLLSDKWVLAIAVTLQEGPRRRVDILSACTSYSINEKWSDKPAVLQDSILGRHLKKMRELGLIDRTSCTKSFPPQAVYSLNPAVADLLGLMTPLIAWARAHPDIIEKAQAYGRNHSSDRAGGHADAELAADEAYAGETSRGGAGVVDAHAVVVHAASPALDQSRAPTTPRRRQSRASRGLGSAVYLDDRAC